MKYLFFGVILLGLVSCGGSGTEREPVEENNDLFSYQDIEGSWESECYSDAGGRMEHGILSMLDEISEYEPGMQVWFKRKLHFDQDSHGAQIYFYITPDCSDTFSEELGLDVVLRIFDSSIPVEDVPRLVTDEGYDAIELEISDNPFSGTFSIGVTMIESVLYMVRSDSNNNVFIDFSVSFTRI